MDNSEEVILWKAPQPGRAAALEVVDGFDPDQYPGDGPYFAFQRTLAEKWQNIYKNGLQEIHLPQDVCEELEQLNVIRPDGYYPGQSCHVPPDGLGKFNAAIKQGSENLYHPQFEEPLADRGSQS